MSQHGVCGFHGGISQWAWIFLLPAVVLSSPIFPGLKTRRNISDEWETTVLKQRLKVNILKELNRSSVPFYTPRTLPLPPKNKAIEGSAKAQKSKNVSLILSEPTAPYRRDFMVFKIHSKVRSRLSHEVIPVIVLRLRLNSKRSSSRKKQDKEAFMRMKIYENLCKGNSNERNSSMSTQLKSLNIPEEASQLLLNSTTICKNFSKKTRKLNRRRRLKSRKIRIIVRVFDPSTNKKVKIFVKRMVLKKIKVLSVPVPRDIFISAAESEKHALVVQVSCRNCKRYVRMDRVYGKGKKKQNANSLRLNPNRPLMYITTVEDDKNNDNVNKEGRRSKRHITSPNSCSNQDTVHNRGLDIFNDESHLQCCEQTSYYSFEELGLSDIIIYPQGFFTVDCLGTCRNSNKNIPTSRQLFKEDVHGHERCISTTKSSLDALYFADSNTIIPKRFVDFIGESCGCASV